MKTRSTYAYVDDEQSELQLNIKTRLLANDLRYMWKSGFWVRLPWLGFGSLLAIFLCEFSSGGFS